MNKNNPPDPQEPKPTTSVESMADTHHSNLKLVGGFLFLVIVGLVSFAVKIGLLSLFFQIKN